MKVREKYEKYVSVRIDRCEDECTIVTCIGVQDEPKAWLVVVDP